MHSKHLARACAGFVLAMVACAAQAGTYSSLVVFGDSLSDSGNNALLVGTDPSQVISGDGYYATMPYASGTYSNGNVWTTTFAQSLGLQALPSLAGGTNYAYGGAQVVGDGPGPDGFPFSLSTQLGQYLGQTGGVADPNALYVIAGGGNDVRVALETLASGGSVNPAQLASSVASGLGSLVSGLQAAGAQHIVVWDVPDFGETPLALSDGPQAAAVATALSAGINQALTQTLAGDSDVRVFDVFGLMDQLIASGQGFADFTDACGAPSLNCSVSTSLFYDGIHPTTVGHDWLADQMLSFVDSVPEPHESALLGVGLLMLAARLRRRRV